MSRPTRSPSIAAAIDTLIAHVGSRIVLAIPLGIGKPNPFVNALYRRVKESPLLELKIITALSFEKPRGLGELEQRFLGPFVERVFGDYPDLDYVADSRYGRLPPNISVYEFFMKTGDYLGNAIAQQHYIYSNYSHVARDMVVHGVNVLAQAIAVDESGDAPRYSLSSNPDVTIDLLALYRSQPEQGAIAVGVINRKMPFMPNDAEVAADMFDIIVDDPLNTHDPFAPPNMKVDLQDYAIALWASTMVPDGGTLQIGIGSLGDGVAQALIVRERRNAEYRRVIADLAGGERPALPAICHFDTFRTGLYGCSEMFVNGFLWLIEAGIVRREVYPDVALQRLINEGGIGKEITLATLAALHAVERISDPLTSDDVAFLKRFGILRADVQWQEGMLARDGKIHGAAISSGALFEAMCADCLGSTLTGGVFLHGGFFLGPRAFYQALRDMPIEQRARINMSRIRYINELLGHEEIASLQRTKARFINATMMVTLLGAAVSDSLDSGQLVSGVGGQYNFVAMGHALPDARSILIMRAWRTKNDKVHSNIVWNYAHTTIPRHLRDIVITEYGIANLRGQSDEEVIKRLLAITDSRFQDELIDVAKANGKLNADFELPETQRRNFPARIDTALKTWHDQGLLPDFPLGTDFTDDELVIVRALARLKRSSEHPLELVKMLIESTVDQVFDRKDVPDRYLARMGFTEAHGLKDKLMRNLFVGSI
jgi:acyl-CoA hydrolase